MWCAAKGINCPDCGVFGECQKSCCGLPNAEPSTLGTSSSYLVNTTSEKLITEQEKEIERLKAENACLLKACEGQFTFDTTENKKYSIFNSVRKEFADEVKAKLLAIFGKTICSDLDTEDITDIIDELLEEYGK